MGTSEKNVRVEKISPIPSSLSKLRKNVFSAKRILLFRVMRENFFHRLKCIEKRHGFMHKNIFKIFYHPGGGEKLQKKLEIPTAPNLREAHKIFFPKICILKTTIFWKFFEIFLSAGWLELKNPKKLCFLRLFLKLWVLYKNWYRTLLFLVEFYPRIHDQNFWLVTNSPYCGHGHFGVEQAKCRRRVLCKNQHQIRE